MFMFMKILYVILLCSSSLMLTLANDNSSPNPYLTSTTLFHRNYQKMVQNFKIFIYKPNTTQFNFNTKVESLFYSSLQNSSYLTQHAEEAHLFFLPFSPDTPTRSLERLITRIRNDFPYWNRTLGADHFFLSCDGILRGIQRNLVELKKNAIQISCFTTRRDRFVPHKDVTLPPVADSHALQSLGGDEFCVVEYEKKNKNDVLLGEALRLGCVPVVVTEGPVNDMPFMDVLTWREMVVLVKSIDKEIGEVKGVLGNNDTWRERHVYMRGLGVAASKHLQWNSPPQPFDAFNTIMYQLWLRRHTVRYANIQ